MNLSFISQKIVIYFILIICSTIPCQEETVYVCTGKGAYSYHKKKECSRCSKEKIEMKKIEAEKIGFTACLKCYKKKK